MHQKREKYPCTIVIDWLSTVENKPNCNKLVFSETVVVVCLGDELWGDDQGRVWGGGGGVYELKHLNVSIDLFITLHTWESPDVAFAYDTIPTYIFMDVRPELALFIFICYQICLMHYAFLSLSGIHIFNYLNFDDRRSF